MLKPFAQFGGIGDAYGNVANTNYHGLQISLMQRPHNGLNFMMNYTWSKAIDDGGGFRSGYDIPAQYSGDGKFHKIDSIERGVSTSNQPQHIVLTGVYDLPFGRGAIGGENAVARAFFSGFKFSTIFQARFAADHYRILLRGQPGCRYLLPNLQPLLRRQSRKDQWIVGAGITAANPATKYIDTNAFILTPSTAAAPVFSNAARTAPYGITGPGNYSLDVSLRRSFGIPGWERAHLLLEGDLYNVTNHTQFGGIGTSFGSGNFGQVSNQSNLSRDAQLTGRFEF